MFICGIQRDQANGTRATVVKFDGTNWVPVGSVGFSTQAIDEILAVQLIQFQTCAYVLYSETFSFGVPPFIKAV